MQSRLEDRTGPGSGSLEIELGRACVGRTSTGFTCGGRCRNPNGSTRSCPSRVYGVLFESQIGPSYSAGLLSAEAVFTADTELMPTWPCERDRFRVAVEAGARVRCCFGVRIFGRRIRRCATIYDGTFGSSTFIGARASACRVALVLCEVCCDCQEPRAFLCARSCLIS